MDSSLVLVFLLNGDAILKINKKGINRKDFNYCTQS